MHTEFLITNSKIYCIMKKFIFLLFIAAAITFSSCDNDGKPHCWQTTAEAIFEGYPVKDINYFWMTADEIDALSINAIFFYEMIRGCTDVKVTYKKVKLSEEDCKAKHVEW